MKIRIIFIVMFLLSMASCYDDKGNYDYKEMNDIEISVSTETFLLFSGRQGHFKTGVNFCSRV